MNTNFLNTLVTDIITTKEDIIIALTEGEVEGWKRSMKKSDLMEILVNAIEEADAIKAKEETTMKEANIIDSNKAHVEAEAHVTSLEEEEAIIAMEGDCIALGTKRRAEAFYRIAIAKKYEVLKDEEGNPCKSFKSYVNDFRGGEVYGVKYTTAMNYVNCVKYVYPQYSDFAFWGSHLLFALIKPLRNKETRSDILEAIKANILNKYMKEADFKNTIKDILGEAKEAEAVDEGEVVGNGYEASNTCEVSDEAIDEAVEKMEAFLEANAHDSDITSAWYVILKALDR